MYAWIASLIIAFTSPPDINAYLADLESRIEALENQVAQPTPQPPQLVLSAADDPPGIVERYDELGIHKSYWIPGPVFDPDLDHLWGTDDDRQRLLLWLDANVPADFDGYICNDWETVLKVLVDPDHPFFEASRASVIAAIDYVELLRPAAKVGHYNIPIRNYWHQDDAWLAMLDTLQPILDASTAVFVIAYEFYREPEPLPNSFPSLVHQALTRAGDRPVVVYVNHRYHPSSAQPFELIPEDDFAEHVSTLMTIEVDGVRPRAVCFWAHDSWYLRTAIKTNDDGTWMFNESNGYKIIDIVRESGMPAELEPWDGDDVAYREWMYERIYARLHMAIGDD